VRKALASAEQASGAARRDALTKLSTQLESDASGARDSGKVRILASAVRDLAAASP
jgi:multidrug efflux pump subunit AcrA (membrane-fusion protein)